MRFRKFYFSLLLLLASLASVAQSSQDKITVIGNGVSYTSLSTSELKEIFLGEQQVDLNKNTITVVLPTADFIGANEVASLFSGMSLTTFRRYWLSLVFQGRANPPVYLSSNQKIIDFVLDTPGAIAILYDYNGPVNFTTIPINDSKQK